MKNTEKGNVLDRIAVLMLACASVFMAFTLSLQNERIDILTQEIKRVDKQYEVLKNERDFHNSMELRNDLSEVK